MVGAAARPLQRKRPDDPYHAVFADFIARANEQENCRILELGARGTHVDPRLRGFSQYVGFDIHPGPNVDVVGDVHSLSQLVCGAVRRRLLRSPRSSTSRCHGRRCSRSTPCSPRAVFCSLATHQSWPPHELPWDFWRYSPAAFQVLLNRHTGFEILRAEEGLPALIVPMVRDVGTRDVHRSPASLGVSVLARKVSAPRPDLRWDLTAADVVANEYPKA